MREQIHLDAHRRMVAVAAIFAVTAALLLSVSLTDSAQAGQASAASEPPVWVNDQAYGSAGGGFYWDFASGQVWTAERAWHLFSPQPPRNGVPLWANYATYGSKGGGFYLDPLTGLVWTSERGWHLFNPVPTGSVTPPATPTPAIPSYSFGALGANASATGQNSYNVTLDYGYNGYAGAAFLRLQTRGTARLGQCTDSQAKPMYGSFLDLGDSTLDIPVSPGFHSFTVSLRGSVNTEDRRLGESPPYVGPFTCKVLYFELFNSAGTSEGQKIFNLVTQWDR